MRKIISYILIYFLIFNLFSNILFVEKVYSNNINNSIESSLNNSKEQESEIQKDYSEDRVIVKLKEEVDSSDLASFSSVGAKDVEILEEVGMSIVSVDKEETDVETIVSNLKKLDNVEYVEYDYIREKMYTWVTTNDTYSGSLRYLDSINAEEAWNIYSDTENKTIVSVNDSWIDYNHPDLAWNMLDLSSDCKSDTGATISCPNHGLNVEWDWNYDSTTAVLAENEIYDTNWHWTHVAWTIWAVWNNGTGVIWVTQNVSLMWARLETYHDSLSIFYVSNTVRWINFALQNWAKIINASYWWSSFSQSEYDAIAWAQGSGVLLIAAAWNSANNNDGATKFYPSSYDLDNIIAVASVWNDDNLAYYSNYWATAVDLSAPWWNTSIDSWILSTYPYYETVWSHDMDSFSWITTSWSTLSWNINSSKGMIETQSWAEAWDSTYTWSENKTLTFDTTIDLSWAKFAKFEWHIECALQSWDELEIFINDESLWTAYPNWTYARSLSYWNVVLPIPSNLYNTWAELKVKFSSNSDSTVSYGCALNSFSIVKFDATKNKYTSLQGTSMATPVVSWAAAMLRSYKPDLTYLEVKNLILDNVDTFASLSWKVLSSWKLNIENSLKNLITTYWITKNWTFTDTQNIKNIDLDNKTITLSWATFNITGTWNVITMTGSSAINWTWTINISTGKTLVFSDTSKILETTSDFDIVVKTKTWQIISSWATVYGESLLFNNAGSFSWSFNVELKNGSTILYDGLYSQDMEVAINTDMSWSISSTFYTNWQTSEWISENIKLKFLETTTLWDINFSYTPSSFTWTISFSSWGTTNNTTTTINLSSTTYPADYSLWWDIVWTFTWTLTWAKDINIELSSWDWVKTVTGTLTNLAENTSNFSGQITLDQTTTAIISTNTSTGQSAKSIEFSLSSNDSNFDSSSVSWSNNLNGTTWTWLSYTVSWETSTWLIATATYSDTLWNTWSINSLTYNIDNTGPTAPTNIVINSWENINSLNVNWVTITWSWDSSESPNLVYYSFSDTSNWLVSWTWVVSWRDFSFSWVDLSSLIDWAISYELYLTDTLQNSWSISTWSITKDTMASTWSVSLSSIVNSTWTTITLVSSEYPIDYNISWDIISTKTWTLNNSWSVNIELSSSEWQKNITIYFTDSSWNNSQNYTGTVTLDQTKPTIIFLSYSNNQKVELSSITLTWTVSDTNWIESLSISSSGISLSGSTFSSDITLTWAINIIDYELKDTALNSLTWSINIIRTSKIDNISKQIVSTWSVILSFETDLVSTWEILYWTGESNLDNTISITDAWTNHTKTLTSLLEDTKYYYKIRANNDGYTWSYTNTSSFITAKSLDIDTISWTVSNTWSVLLKWNSFNSTWAIFNSTGSIDLKDENGESSVVLSLSWLTISTSWWDWVFNPPEQVTFSWSFTDSSYSLDSNLSYDIWSKDSELVLSWSEAQVNLNIWTSYNWQTKWVFRSSDNWATYSNIATCEVSSWVCSFTTDRFSLFALASPSDTTPDAFSFTDVTNSELQTVNTSNTITISWINTWATISIVWGSYMINTWSYTTSTWVVYSWNTVTVKLTSSSSNSTSVSSVLTIWWVSDTYSITTKAQTVSSWGWWGWWWWVSYSTCIDSQLMCKSVAWSKTLFKWYKKEGVTCIWGNLWKKCALEEKEDLQMFIEDKTDGKDILSIKELEEKTEFKIKVIEKFYNNKKEDIDWIDDKLSSILYLWDVIKNIQDEYRQKYALWLKSLQNVENNLLDKKIEQARSNFIEFFKQYSELKS